MDKLQHVLFVLPEFFPETSGGICSFYNNLLQELENAPYHITVVQGSAFDKQGGYVKWSKVDVHRLTKEAFAENQAKLSHLSVFPELQNHVASAWALHELANSLNIPFDVVVTTDWGWGFLPWIIKGNVPVVIHLHGSIGQIDHYEPRKGLEFWSKLYLHTEIDCFNQAQALFTYSHQNQLFWTQRQVDEQKFSVFPPLIKNGRKPLPKQKQERLTGLVVGRIQYWKGVIQLCEALELLTASERSQLQLYWVGRDTFYHEENAGMESFLAKKFPNTWGKILLPLGGKTHDEIDIIYQQVDFTLVPSTWDMFNITAIEHLLHEKPLICSTGAGASDFLADCPGVFIFNNTASGLAQQIRSVSQTAEEELFQLGKEACQFVLREFDKEKIIAQNNQMLAETLQRFSPGPDLSERFSMFVPSPNPNSLARAQLTATWTLKELVNIATKRLKKKIKAYIGKA